MSLHPIVRLARLAPAALALFAAPLAAAAQHPDAAAAVELAACAAAARDGEEAAARAAADRATRLFRELTAQAGRRADGLTGEAAVISRCRIPLVPLMRRAALAAESMERLELALAADSLHIGARFLLAMTLDAMPAFLGHGVDAQRQFERLIALHGDRSDAEEVRIAYRLLGDHYLRAGRRSDALATWQRGLALWPDDPALRARLEANGGRAAAADGAAHPTPAHRAGAPVLEAARHALPPIIVEVGGVAMDAPRSATRLTRLDVYTAPGGTADVLQVFQTMPGVTRVADGSDLYVRGGDPAETPVFVDGARLHQPGMFESLGGTVFGVLDPAVLRRAWFSSGGFSARFGNALSGVLDIETDGRPDRRGWRAGANLATLGATLRAPLGPRAGAWAGLTGTDASLLVRTQGRAADYASPPRAVKGVAGLVLDAGPAIEVRGTALLEHDRTEVQADAHGWRGPFRSSGGTRLGALSLRAVPAGGRATLRAGASWSERELSFAFGVLDRVRADRYAGVRVEVDREPRAGPILRTGLEAARLSYDERGLVPVTERVAPGSPARAVGVSRATQHVGAWLEAEQRVRPDVALIVGARADRLPGEAAWTADPRLAVAWRGGDWTLRAATGIFHQGRWRMRYRLPDAGSPSGVPTRARHHVLGAQYEGRVSLRAEAYRKDWDRWADDGGRGPRATDGRALGIDVLLRWSTDRNRGWLTWSWLDGAVELEDGRRVPSATAVAHTATAVSRQALGDHWEVGTTLRYATGRPYSPLEGVDDDGTVRYGPIHAQRLPAQLRLDGRLTRLVPARDGVWVLYVEGLNLLNRRNVMNRVWDTASGRERHVHSFFAHRTLVLGVEAQF